MTAPRREAKLSGKRRQQDQERPEMLDWCLALEPPAEAVVLMVVVVVLEPSKTGDIVLQHSANTHTHTHTHTHTVVNSSLGSF